jgi:hypothetical protein
MNTLSLILWDNRTKQVLRDEVFSIQETYAVLDDATEHYETNGIYLVNEIKYDINTMVREFATIEDGLVISLIVCGGRALGVDQV